MRSVDTNVVVRILVRDDDAQTRLADQKWDELLASGGIFLSKVVLVESVWVARVSYRFERATIAEAIGRLIDLDGVAVEQEPTVRRALARFEHGSADFADYVILESSREVHALPVLTFDERFGREADVELIAPGQTEAPTPGGGGGKRGRKGKS
jgi:predicted nucleic-acid-binding protein